MNRFLLEIDASSIYAVDAPVLEVLVDGIVVDSFSISSDATYSATIDFSDITSFPSSLQFRFTDSSGETGRSLTISELRINGQLTDGADLTMSTLVKDQMATFDVAGNDHLFGRVEPGLADLGTVTETGTGGNDTLQGNLGDDVVDGGAGNDRIRGVWDDDALFGGSGNDTIFGEAGNDIIVGDAGNDLIFGNAGDDLIFGGDDTDTLIGGDGDDVLNGGAGTDYLLGDAGNDILYGEDGNDILVGLDGNDSMYGDAGNDTLAGGAGADTMYGGDDNDTLVGDAGDDVMSGDAGDDIVMGGAGNDTISGGLGADMIYGGDNDDTLSGDDGDDYLNGGEGDDSLEGGADSDVLTGGAGADFLDGGAADDILHGHGLDENDISIILRNNPGVVYDEASHSFYQFVNTSADYDTAQANADAATLNGVSGHLVTITSAAENTFVSSLISGDAWSAGQDIQQDGTWQWSDGLEVGVQFSDISGISILGSYENWDAGQPQINTEYNTVINANGTWHDWADTSSHAYVIEWEVGLFNDDNASDTLYGRNGHDQLYGYGGDDILDGGNGNDMLYGGAGDDDLSGGNGNDYIRDEEGNNTFSGGDGDDILDARTLNTAPSIADQVSAILAANPGVTYDAASNSFYMYETTNYTWDQAVTNANSTTINGIGGHLAVITSSAENSYVASLISSDSWIGASDAGTEGNWVWVGGPDDGQMFWQGTATGSAQNGYYNNWNGGEPNNSGNEDAAEINVGGGWNDQGTGSTQDSVIEWDGADLLITPVPGTSGDDTFDGGAGDDIIYAADGDDTIYGGADNDTIYGGDGTDTLTYSAAASGITADLQTGITSIDGDGGTDTFYEIEAIIGSAHVDTITGSDGDDNISGGGSGDNLDGGTGDDVINGDGGNDTIQGGEGNDTIYGGDGDDVIDASSLSVTSYTIQDALNDISGLVYDATTESFYLHVDAGANYGTAVSNANAMTLNGVAGHLAVITSAAENTLIDNMRTNDDIWLGGTDSASEGAWVWNGGVEDGQQFSSGGAAVNGYYTNWRSGEPNSGNPADALYIDNNGEWRDQRMNRTNDYVIEWEASEVLESSSLFETNVIDGGAGNDTINGSAGTDTLIGGSGNDVINSGSQPAITVSDALSEISGLQYNATTGNFYYVETTAQNYTTAKTDAETTFLNGVSGHLLTIESAAENSYIDGIAGTIWLGINDAGVEGEWRFDGGPNDGDLFWLGDQNGSSQNGYYENWNNNEPNDYGSGEDYAQFLNGGGWNDINGTGSYDYVIEWEGSQVLAGSPTILNGGDGLDTLNGSSGADYFVFEVASAFNDIDVVNGFDASQGDALDISDILSGYNPLTDAITDFIQITDSGSNSVVRVDATGSGSFGAGTQIATLNGVTGLTDEAQLETDGNLITV